MFASWTIIFLFVERLPDLGKANPSRSQLAAPINDPTTAFMTGAHTPLPRIFTLSRRVISAIVACAPFSSISCQRNALAIALTMALSMWRRAGAKVSMVPSGWDRPLCRSPGFREARSSATRFDSPPRPRTDVGTVKVDVYPLHEQLENGSVRLGTSLRAASSNSRTGGASFPDGSQRPAASSSSLCHRGSALYCL
jgi:hypothetical protein